MAISGNKFTIKIILSYLVLSALAFFVGFFLYSEFEKLTSESVKNIGEKKFIETGTLINLVYEADGFSRLALLTEDDSDFEKYIYKTDSLFLQIKEIKNLTTDSFQIKQLDTVKSLLIEKNQNIEQLRILRLTNQKDTSLDEILKEVQKLEASIGLISVETLFKNPSKLSPRERKIWQRYADYLNSNVPRDPTVKSQTVDSMLAASRYIVAEAKKKNSRIRQSLQQKENELIRNDLKISERLRQIIESFDTEIAKRNESERQERSASIERTGEILKFAGILGGGMILIFSYFILSDFFRAERYKQNLEASKKTVETLLKSREQLIGTVSHDLKTPLNTIIGYAELFHNSPLTDKQEQYLNQITSSSHFIGQLVNDLLDYSKLEAGKMTIESVPFNLKNIVEESAYAAKQVYQHKPVELTINIDRAIQHQFFSSDPLRIRQIINNLIGNAFKFTERGSVEITVEETVQHQDTATVQISVKDTGIGISKEKQNLIFEEFTQAEADTSRKFGGSGLGLAISKKLSELLHGSLTVQSTLGKGSTFILTLPLKKIERKEPEKKGLVEKSLKKIKGIILDDDQAMRSLLAELLQKKNIETYSFSGYQDLKKNISNKEYHFILTDIQMPELDGFSVLENLQKGAIANYSGQPVIAMTGNGEFSEQHYLEKGFTAMLPKPFSGDKLLDTLKAIFPDFFHAAPRIPSEEKMVPPLEKPVDGVLDLTLLKSFVSSPESLQEILDLFIEQTEEDLYLLETAVENKDIQFIKDIAHRMLTMTRQIQAKKIVPLLEKMEEYEVETTAKEILLQDYDQLKKEISELLQFLVMERN